MPTQILMPKLGLTMTEGTIVEWVAAEGQAVSAGDIVMLIETDKVEAEVEAVADGVVHHAAAVGDTLEPGDGVGWLLGAGEAAPDGGSAPAGAEPAPATADTPEPEASPEPSAATEPTSSGGRILASPNAKRVAAEMAVDLSTVTGTGPGGRITSEDVEAAVPAGRGLGGRILASPYAKRMAAERGVDLATVTGTGPGGRITSEDVESVPAAAPSAPAPAAAPATAPASGAARSDRFV
ncbi:MAG: E3 binding domain-containing protein, partial [Actinomycetota bacterium]